MSPEPAEPTPTLVITAGSRAGARLTVPLGETVIGRDTGADLLLGDGGVSRRHAVVVRTADAVTIVDAGSTNGTWVNGDRISSSRALRSGDRITMGSAAVRVEGIGAAARGPSRAGRPSAVRTPRRKLRLWKILLVGAVLEIVLNLVNLGIKAFTDSSGVSSIFGFAAAGVAASVIELVRQELTSGPESPSTDPVPPPKRGRGVAVGVLVTVLIIGGGGALLTYAVNTVSGLITGDQGDGDQRLQNGPVAVESAGVLLTVHTVVQTRDFTRVQVTVENNTSGTLALPLFRNASLVADDGSALQADAFRSTWVDSVAPQQRVRGTLIFPGRLTDAGTTASLAFAHVAAFGGGGPDSFVVSGLAIAPVGPSG